MSRDLVLNDLSINSSNSIEEARQNYILILQSASELIANSIANRMLHTSIVFYDLSLYTGYTLMQCIEEPNIDRDLKLFALHLGQSNPVDAALKAATNDQYLMSEYRVQFNGVATQCQALGVASAIDGVALSIPSDQLWRQPEIPIEQRLYAHDFSFENINIRVLNISGPEMIGPIRAVVQQLMVDQVTDSRELLAMWNEILPHLDSSIELPAMIAGCVGEQFNSVKHRLIQLESACRNWNTGVQSQPPYPMHARTDSVNTLQRFGAERTYTCPVRGSLVFDMHCNIYPSGHRLYWSENRETGRITVGFFGSHPRDATFRG